MTAWHWLDQESFLTISSKRYGHVDNHEAGSRGGSLSGLVPEGSPQLKASLSKKAKEAQTHKESPLRKSLPAAAPPPFIVPLPASSAFPQCTKGATVFNVQRNKSLSSPESCLHSLQLLETKFFAVSFADNQGPFVHSHIVPTLLSLKDTHCRHVARCRDGNGPLDLWKGLVTNSSCDGAIFIISRAFAEAEQCYLELQLVLSDPILKEKAILIRYEAGFKMPPSLMTLLNGKLIVDVLPTSQCICPKDTALCSCESRGDPSKHPNKNMRLRILQTVENLRKKGGKSSDHLPAQSKKDFLQLASIRDQSCLLHWRHVDP